MSPVVVGGGVALLAWLATRKKPQKKTEATVKAEETEAPKEQLTSQVEDGTRYLYVDGHESQVAGFEQWDSSGRECYDGDAYKMSCQELDKRVSEAVLTYAPDLRY